MSPASISPWATDFIGRLRAATAERHVQLEAELDLLSPGLDRQRMRCVLERFHGFHVVWEKAVARRSRLREFAAGRSRLPHLRRDLMALGSSVAQIDVLPRCEAADALASSDAGAVGALYVVEGSTLGGQVIGRALAGADWLPEGGLSYFKPYGAQTGPMWRTFRGWAADMVGPDQADAAAAGARQAFELLIDWLPETA